MRPLALSVLLSVLALLAAVRGACRSTHPSSGPPGPEATPGSSIRPSGAPAATSSTGSRSAPFPADPWATASWSEAPLAWASVPAALSKPRGAHWSTRAAGTDDGLRAVFGTSRNDVWIGGDGGELLRTKDGGRTFARADIGEDIMALWGAGPDDVWVLGKRHAHRVRGGTSLARLSVEGDFRRVSGTSATDVWIAAGELLHTADGGATFKHVDPDPSALRTNEVWASSTSGVWATVPFFVVHSGDGGRTWPRTSLAIASEDDYRLRGSASDVWIVGYRAGPSRSTDGGLTWREEGPPPMADFGRQRFWVDLWSSGDRAWAATSDAIWVRASATRWIRALEVTKVEAMWASGPEDVWAVGDGGLILHSP